jgi:hypothetical protein
MSETILEKDGSLTIQLFKKTDWNLAAVNNAPALGVDIGNGTFNASSALVGFFDLRPFKTVKFYFYSGGSTGTVTPRMFAFDQATFPGGNYWPLSITGKPLPTGGGGQTWILKDGVVPTIISAGSNFETDLIIAPKPDFCQFYLAPGALSALTSFRTVLYGSR